ncbi:MAG TPA: c-type cytochrome domain-containing protein, partial [Flavisolibacter sp.]|nr:c-type cytochrome domain-containing protein [Flavisolibacter sp.]
MWNLSVTEFIGRFHPVIVHLPIGILLTGLMLQWVASREKYKISTEAIKIVLLVGMLTAVISCITGYLLSLDGDYDDKLVRLHMWMGFAVAAGSIFLCLKLIRRKSGITYKVASFFLLILIIITGHLGGTLTHGSNYLLSALSADNDTIITVKKNIVNVQEAKAYSDVIEPIFQTKCFTCHGPKKQKGNFRMDDPLLLLKGGKKGKEIMPGNANESEMIKRIFLPKEEDHHMPPKEKAQLTEKQIILIQWWIDQGADFSKKVYELKQNEKVKPALLSVQNNHQEHKAPTNIPQTPIQAADKKDLDTLKKLNVVILPVAAGVNYLTANFITAPNITDKQLELLLPMKKQLVWLNLSNTKITDNAISALSKCINLRELDLSNTSISDNGLRQLTGLDSLQSLTLVGTAVTAKGLHYLDKLKKLKYIYVYHTRVT